MRRAIQTLAAILLLSFPVGAANKYVLAGAAGTGTTDWSNAAPCLKNVTIVRGDVVYIARGNYESCQATHWEFDVATSGTTTIELRAATAADHGTDTGWNAGTMEATGANPAILHPIRVRGDDYIIINGVSRTTSTTGYRLKILNSNGAGGQKQIWGLSIGDAGSNDGSSNVTIKYVEVEGSSYDDGPNCATTDKGIVITPGSGAAASNNLVQYSYFHDTGGESADISAQDLLTIEYSYFARNHSGTACHGDGIAANAVTNWTFRYNVVEDMEGTCFLCDTATASSQSNWHIYANVFWRPSSPARGSVSNGLIAFVDSGQTWAGTNRVYNNTFFNANPGGSSRIYFGSGLTIANMEVRNNLWDQCSDDMTGSQPSAVTGSWTFSHNAHFDCGTSDATGTAQNASGEPLTDPFNKNWIPDGTPAINNGTNLGSPYDFDPNGVARPTEWTRGAFAKTPPPPGNPQTQYSVTSLSFGDSPVGSGTVTQTITLTNVGDASLTISSIAATGTNAADFHVSTTCGGSLAASANCAINVYFNPGAAGSRSGALTVTTNAASSPDALTLSGTGVAKNTTGTVVIQADTQAPQLSVKCPSQVRNSLTCDLFCCTDNVGVVSVDVHLGAFAEKLILGTLIAKKRSWNFDVSKLPRGALVFAATAHDAAGNSATTSTGVILY